MSDLVLTMSAIPVPVPAADDPDAGALARLRSGDRGAAAAIWERHGAVVWRVAARCCPHPADAEDVMQEVALDLLRRPPAAIRGGGLQAWLCLAAANRARKRLRDEARRRRRQLPLDDRPAPVPAEPPALAERALAALDGLPAAYREPVRLRCMERLEFPLVAVACGIGERTARTRVSRGLARLRAALGVPGTGLAGIALLLPVRPVPGMPAELPLRLAAPTATTAAATAGTSAIAASIGAGLAAAGCAAWLAIGAGDPQPVLAGGGPGSDDPPASATMAALRVWREPGADLQMEVDLDRLRAVAVTRPPFSALVDPRLAGMLSVLVMDEPETAVRWRDLLGRAVRSGGGWVFSLRPRSASPGGWLVAADAGADLPGDPAAGDHRRIGRATVRAATGVATLAQDGRIWWAGSGDLPAAAAAATASRPVVDAPAWLRVDGRPLLAAYARLAPADGDPAGVGLLLGDGWRRMAPILTATAAAGPDGWHGAARLAGAGPFQLLRLVEALPPDTRRRIGPFRPVADGIRLPARPDDLLRWDAGLDVARLLELDVDPATLGIPVGDSDLGGLVISSTMTGLTALQATGDVSVRMRPGIPAPEVDIVLGIRRDPATTGRWLGSLARVWGLADLGMPATGAWVAGGWGLETPVGRVAIRHRPGAVAVTLRGPMADPAAWTVGTGPAWMPGDALLYVDGPRLAPLLGVAAGGLRLAGADDLAGSLDGIARLGRHLPVYRLAYTTTADGFAAEEHGAPLLVPGLGFLAGALLWKVDPAAETAAGMAFVRLARRVPAAPARLLLERLATVHAADPERQRWSDLLAAAGVDERDLARALGLADGAGIPARRIAADRLTVHRLEDLRDVLAVTGGSDGRPVMGWELPLGDGASLYLLHAVRIGGVPVGVWIGPPAGSGVRPVEGF